jgi:hypothetical protein
VVQWTRTNVECSNVFWLVSHSLPPSLIRGHPGRASGGGPRPSNVRTPRGLGAREGAGICDFEPVSFLRLYKIAHSDRRLSPARTDARPHVAKMWAARNITVQQCTDCRLVTVTRQQNASGDEARQLGGLLALLLGLNLLPLLDERSGGPSFLRHVLGS